MGKESAKVTEPLDSARADMWSGKRKIKQQRLEIARKEEEWWSGSASLTR